MSTKLLRKKLNSGRSIEMMGQNKMMDRETNGLERRIKLI